MPLLAVEHYVIRAIGSLTMLVSRMLTVLVLVLSTSPIISVRLSAQDVRSDSRVQNAISLLDRWIDAQQAYQQFPGISIGIVHDQELLWAKGFGVADVDSRRPATAGTVYSICSISKLFTSIAAMRLVDKGSIELDAQVMRLLPWFDVATDETESQLISLRSLLTHTSGLEEDIGVPPDSLPYLYWATRDDVRSLLPQEELRHRPGMRYTYSNLGMALVGQIIEEVSGDSFEKYVRRQILEPLGMSSTTPDIGELWDSDQVATGYGPVSRGGGRAKIGRFRGNAMIPAMGFASTVEDLAKFISWQFRLLDGREEILDSGTLQEMYRVQFADSTAAVFRGLGFTIYRDGPTEIVGHSGFCAGFQSDLAIDPKRRLGVVALANSMIPAWEFTSRVHEILGPAIEATLNYPSGDRPTPEEFQPYVGTYEGFPWSGEWQVIPWNGSLAVLHLPVDDPLEVLRPLEHVEGSDFRVADSDSTAGLRVRFESDASGCITRMLTGNYPRRRIR